MNRWEQEAQERADHAAEMRRTYLADDIPSDVADELYAHAWQEGHAYGFNEVANHYMDLAALVERAYRAGVAS